MSKRKPGRPWTPKEDDQLIELISRGAIHAVAGKKLGRTTRSIGSRITVIRNTVGIPDGRTKSKTEPLDKRSNENSDRESYNGKPIDIWLAAMQRVSRGSV